MHGYPKKLVDNQLRRVVENQQEQFSEHQKKHGTGVPIAVTYHPWFHDLGRIIYSYAEEQVKEVYTPPAPFALFQSGFSLTNHLVQAKAYPLLRDCQKIQKINYRHCDSRCIIYLLYCKVCVVYSVLGQRLIDFI